MHFHFTFRTRDDVIAFGRHFGSGIEDMGSDRPVALVAEGAFKTSKSLLALAIDYGLSPGRYPYGVTTDIEAEKFLTYTANPGRKTAFINLNGRVETQQSAFDAVLHDLERNMSGARVIYISNLKRDIARPYDYAAKGLNSDRLNVHFYFEKSEQGEHKLAVTAEDAALVRRLREQPVPLDYGPLRPPPAMPLLAFRR